MWAEKVYRDQRGRCAPADGGARQPEACVGCSRSRSRRVEGTRPPRIWPGARAYRASRAPLWALRLAGTGAESGRRGCVRQQRRGLEIAWTSGICVALQRMRRFRVLRPAEGLLGANASWRVWRTPLDPSKAQHRQNAIFVAFVNSAPIVSTDCVILAAIAAPFLPQTPVPDLSGAVAQVSGEFFVLTRYCRASRCRGTFALSSARIVALKVGRSFVKARRASPRLIARSYQRRLVRSPTLQVFQPDAESATTTTGMRQDRKARIATGTR